MRQYPSWSSSSYRSSQFPDLEKWNTQEVGSDFLKHSRNLYLYIYIYEGIRLNVWKKLELENEIKGHETSHVMLPHHEAKERASALGFTSDNFLLLWEKETYSYTYTYTYTYTYKWCSCIEPNGWSPHNTLSLSLCVGDYDFNGNWQRVGGCLPLHEWIEGGGCYCCCR